MIASEAWQAVADSSHILSRRGLASRGADVLKIAYQSLAGKTTLSTRCNAMSLLRVVLNHCSGTILEGMPFLFPHDILVLLRIKRRPKVYAVSHNQ